MIHNITSPFDFQFVSDNISFGIYELGSHIDILQEEIYDFSHYQIALLGVKESRNAHPSNISCDIAPEEIRKHLYRLQICTNFPKVVDLGNLIEGETPKETYENLTQALNYLHSQYITVLILGGSQDLTISQLEGLQNQSNANVCIVDERIDIGAVGNEPNSQNFLNYLILNQQPQISQLHLMGYQLYFTNSEVISRLESMAFNPVRLANIRYEILKHEYMIRDSDIVSIDISSVKQADAPARSMQTPNGLLSDELCMITRLAGMNYKTKSLGIYEINPNFDIRHQTCILAAQAIWYFLEGFSFRLNLSPELTENKERCKEYLVSNPLFDYPLTFLQYPNINQWWLEIESSGKKNYFPVSQQHYERSVQNDLDEYVFKILSKI